MSREQVQEDTPMESIDKVRICGHQSPLNYDQTRWCACELLIEHDGEHRQGDFVWTDRTMPYRERRAVLETPDER